MGLGTKAYLVGAILTFYSSFAAALGLGEITLNSVLNQPLNAEIQLLHVRDLTEREIIVSLASSEEFARAGVDRSFFLTDLKFNVDLNAQGGPVVHVTSKNPIREPFVNFLVVAQWPSGKLLREYTLLVDLPVFSGSKAAPVQAAKTEQTVRPKQSRPSSVAPSAPSSSRATYGGDEYGPVGANENLWSIASKVRPDSSVTVQQTMLALQKLNPQAFINNNINLLRRGQVLRVPDKNDIQALSAQDALSQVADQNRQWKQPDRTPDDSAQLEGSKSFSRTRTEPSSPEGRVRLSSGDRPSAARDGAGAGKDESGAQVVANKLAVTQEELDAATRENADLKSRLNSVEEQIQTMEKLVEISSEEMRALELAAQQTVKSEEERVQADAQTAPASEETQEQATAPAQPKSQIEKTWLDLAMDNILYVALGLGALIAGVALLFYLRGRDDGFDDEFNDDLDTDYEYDSQLLAGSAEEDDAALVVPFDQEDDDDRNRDAELSTEAETEDVVGECDIHIAYGQYEQAEEKLNRALEREPTNIPARLKLLEVFAAQSDVGNFDDHFAKIHALGDSEAIDRAAMLRDSIDDAEPFDLAEHDTSHFAGVVAARHESIDEQAERFDSEVSGDDSLGLADDTLQFDLEDEYDLPEPLNPNRGAETSEDDLAFDLSDLDDVQFNDFEDDNTLAQSRPSAAAEDGGLSLDLDLPEEDDARPAETVGVSRAEELDYDRSDELETSLDASENSFDVVDDEYGADESEVTVANTFDKSQAGFGDLDFDLDELNADLSFDDIELELEMQSLDSLAGEDDTVRTARDSANTVDLPEDDVADLVVSLDESDENADFAFDGSLLNPDDQQSKDQLGSDSSASVRESEAVESNEAISEEFDFDLERDLESAISGATVSDNTGGEVSSNGEELKDLDFEDLGDLADLDIDDNQIDGGEAVGFEMVGEDELQGANLAGEPLSGEADEDEPEAIAQALTDAEAEADFDTDLDMDSGFELDDLDKELDSLTSDFDGDLASADALMDEPMTDFDEFSFDELESKTEPSTVAAKNDDRLGGMEIPDFDPDNDDDSNLDFLSDNDETATKLDLARAYIDMGDADGAKDILDEIAEEGNEEQKQEAETLLSRLA